MWCDNCFLVFPLRAGGIALAVIIALYSFVGGFFLFHWGPYIYFMYPEWMIYGGISMVIGGAALVNAIAFSNRSYIWVRVTKFMWPIVVVISGVRAIIMIWELSRGKSKIWWECQNGQLWGDDPTNPTTVSFPTGICTSGFNSLYTALIICLLVDIAFQLYMTFLNWRFSKRLEHYNTMKGPFYGGYYNA